MVFVFLDAWERRMEGVVVKAVPHFFLRYCRNVGTRSGHDQIRILCVLYNILICSDSVFCPS